jgi:acyl-CoA synthetase (AMP-forming)/AMP-acid ligase II
MSALGTHHVIMGDSQDWSWREWSRAAWRRHLPDISDLDAYVAALGEATIHGLARWSAANTPGRLAISVDGVGLTHGALDEMASRVAGWLVGRINPGERVLIAGPVSLDWVACYLGTLRAGGVAALANPSYTAAELDELVGASGATLAIAWGGAARRLAEVSSARALVIVTDDAAGGAGVSDLINCEPDTKLDRTGPGSTAILAFTSGTTGRPKGVPLTHRNLVSSIRAVMAAWRWSSDEVLIHSLPLFHLHGLGGLHATLIAGSSLHIVSHFTPVGLLRVAAESRATAVFAVPTMYQRLAAEKPSASPALSDLRLAVSGSAPLGEDVAAGAAELLGRFPLVRYGTTESGLDTSHVYGDAGSVSLSRTIGLPLPGLEVRIAGDDGVELEAEAEGEIQVRGPQVFAGYWGDPKATSAAFASGGWFRTGDIAQRDATSGHLVIRGRSKEVIITGGLNVYPREVELALEKHPSVREAAVAGIPHERWGEQVTAWVVLKPGYALVAEALIAHARSLLAPYKCPKQVFRVEALPRNDLGKLDRGRLRA